MSEHAEVPSTSHLDASTAASPETVRSFPHREEEAEREQHERQHQQEEQEAEEVEGEEHAASEHARQPGFEPLFTLLTNTTTNATAHPRVHYVFEDDDHSIINSSSCTADPDRRAVIVDLVPSSSSFSSGTPKPRWAVASACSLSPDFAITSSRLTDPSHTNDAMLLRLEGVEREAVELRGEEQEEAGGAGTDRDREEDNEALVEDFRRRMGILERIVGEADRREGLVRVMHDDGKVLEERKEG